MWNLYIDVQNSTGGNISAFSVVTVSGNSFYTVIGLAVGYLIVAAMIFVITVLFVCVERWEQATFVSMGIAGITFASVTFAFPQFALRSVTVEWYPSFFVFMLFLSNSAVWKWIAFAVFFIQLAALMTLDLFVFFPWRYKPVEAFYTSEEYGLILALETLNPLANLTLVGK